MHWEWLVPVIFIIVWIVSSLIQGAEKVKNIALFTTIARLRSGMEKPWVDAFGEEDRI